MKVILEMTAGEALDAIEAGLFTPLLEHCCNKISKTESVKTMEAKTTPATVPVTPMSEIPVVPVEQPPAPQPVPTEVHNYTRDDLSRAAAGLMDAGRLDDLRALLQQFGVDSLVSLKAEQFGAFATAMRGLGAQI